MEVDREWCHREDDSATLSTAVYIIVEIAQLGTCCFSCSSAIILLVSIVNTKCLCSTVNFFTDGLLVFF